MRFPWVVLLVAVLGGCSPSGSLLGKGTDEGSMGALEQGVFVEWSGKGENWPPGAFLPAEWWENLPINEEADGSEEIILAHRPVRRGPAPGVRRPPPLLSTRPPSGPAQYGVRRTVDQRVVEQTRQLYFQRLAEAQATYPNSSGYENHHVIPRYLGGTSQGTTCRLPTAYHKAITQEFRREWPYGQERQPTSHELMGILIRVYSKYPIPQLVGIEP